MLKIDLHTHSVASPDGSLKMADYKKMLKGRLDVIAITDHNTISFAQKAQAELGDKIIVGEEITTSEGEIVGLFLKRLIKPGLSPSQAVKEILSQNGLVYIPHPFETVRKGLSPEALKAIIKDVNIIEVFNGRAVFQNRSTMAMQWAKKYQKAIAASSDAHGLYGWGRTYSLVKETPKCDTLINLLNEPNVRLSEHRVNLPGVCYPKFNRLRKAISF